jgi:hypothetical protein
MKIAALDSFFLSIPKNFSLLKQELRLEPDF